MSMNIKYLLPISFFLALLSWLLPNNYQPWLAAYPNSLALASCLFIFTWAALKQPIQSNNLCFLVLAILLVIMGQYIFSISPYLGEVLVFSLFVIAFYLAYLTGFNLSLSTSKKQNLTTALAALFILGAVISSWIALLQWLQLNGSIWMRDMAPGGRAYANFGQPNNMATALGMGLTGVLYLFEIRQLQRLSAAFLTVFIIFALALAQSRTTWLAGMAVVIFWWWQSRRNGFKPRLSPLFVLFWYLLFIAFVLLQPVLNQWLLMSGPDLFKHAQAAHRWHMWQQFSLAIWHGPWYGYGVGQVAEAQVAVAPIFPLPGLMSFYTHNLVLDILIWFGPVVGGILVAGGLHGLARLGLSARTIESCFALIAAGFIITHSLLEYPHAYLFFLLPLGILLGIAATDLTFKKLLVLPKSLALTAAGVLALFGSWIMAEYVIIENDFRLMRFENAGVGTLKASQAAPDVWLLDNLREYTRLARTPAAQITGEKQLAWAKQVAHHYPFDASLSRYIKALALNGNVEDAVQELRALKGMHNPRYYQSVLLWLESQPDNPVMRQIVDRFGENRASK